MLSNVSHCIFPWLKSPITIQSPLLTSLIAFCMFPLVSCYFWTTIHYSHSNRLCPVTNLHHMASSLSDSSRSCTSYAGIVSLTYNNTPPPLLPIAIFPKHHTTFQSKVSIGYILVCPIFSNTYCVWVTIMYHNV